MTVLTQGVDISLLPYTWIWANAAARTAQSVASYQLNRIGFQQDIGLQFQLNALGTPNRWGELDDPMLGPMQQVRAQAGVTSTSAIGVVISPTGGTLTARTPTVTSKVTQAIRVGYLTAAPAASGATWRHNACLPTLCGGGFRQKSRASLGTVSGAMRWYHGISTTVPTNNDVDPATFVNCIGIGRSGTETNLQLYNNDAAGAAAKTDLGAAFPAATLNDGYAFYLWTLAGTSYGWMVQNINSAAIISGTLSSEVPAAAQAPSFVHYVSNNTDAVQVSLDFIDYQMAQVIA